MVRMKGFTFNRVRREPGCKKGVGSLMRKVSDGQVNSLLSHKVILPLTSSSQVNEASYAFNPL